MISLLLITIKIKAIPPCCFSRYKEGITPRQDSRPSGAAATAGHGMPAAGQSHAPAAHRRQGRGAEESREPSGQSRRGVRPPAGTPARCGHEGTAECQGRLGTAGEAKAFLQIGSQAVCRARAGRFGKGRFSTRDEAGESEGFGVDGVEVDKGQGRRGGLRGQWATLAQGCERDLGCSTP